MTVLRVEVLNGPCADDVATRLRQRDSTRWLAVAVVDHPGTAALTIATTSNRSAHHAADVILTEDRTLTTQVDRLWSERLEPYALGMARIKTISGPPVLHEHDPQLMTAAHRLLTRIREALTHHGLDDGIWTYDHIGSTAVPGLRAKRFIDLQIGASPLPEHGSPVDNVLDTAGFQPAKGSRPDSPGVHQDHVKDPDLAPADAYRKRLYFRPDPAQPCILHIRKLGSPWWSYTVRFRDWLQTSPEGRRAYQELKQQAAAVHAHDVDYDDYTRTKGTFFDQFQPKYE